VVFVLAGVVFWLIDTCRDHCSGVSGQQQLRNLAEGVADRTGLRDEGERPDDVIRSSGHFRGMAIPLTTGNEDAITGMCLCSQQMSTTPE
jgi:hypothetical protein